MSQHYEVGIKFLSVILFHTMRPHITLNNADARAAATEMYNERHH